MDNEEFENATSGFDSFMGCDDVMKRPAANLASGSRAKAPRLADAPKSRVADDPPPEPADPTPAKSGTDSLSQAAAKAMRKLGTNQSSLLKLKTNMKVTPISKGIHTAIRDRFREGEALRRQLAIVVAQNAEKLDKVAVNKLLVDFARFDKHAKLEIGQAKAFMLK